MKLIVIFILSYSLLVAKVDYENYCKSDIKRETHIIIDLNNIDHLLYGRVIKSLSYIPHERVTLYYYDDIAKNIVKDYSFCNPLLSKSEIEQVDNSPFWKKAFGTDIDKMKENQMFLKSKMIKRLTYMQNKLSRNGQSNFVNSFSTLSNEINEQARIIIFTNEKFNKKSRAIDLKYANIYMYQKKLPPLKTILQNKNYFAANNAYLKTIYTRPSKKKEISSLKQYKIQLNTTIKSKKIKSELIITANENGKIINGWYIMYGVLQVPIEGFIKVSNNKIVSLNAKVQTNFKYKNNTAYKGDRIYIAKRNNKYSGKYYNYAYAFKQNTFKYFEYRINE